MSTIDIVCCEPAVGVFSLPIRRRGSDGPTITQRSFTRMMFQPAWVLPIFFWANLASCNSGACYLPNDVVHSLPGSPVGDHRETVLQSFKLQNKF